MREDETAGAREPFEDAALYDWEYRRRRDDVRFYRMLADERGGPILDLACGSGRLLAPLARDGHLVVGIDRSAPMLARAAERVARLPRAARRRVLLARGDLRTLAARPRFAFAIVAFHGIQHLVTDGDLLRFFRRARAALVPGGWLVFDAFVPDADFLVRARAAGPEHRWARTRFRHPTTGERLEYTASYRVDDRRRTLLSTFHYLPVDARGRARGPERSARLCHRQLAPGDVARLLARAGFQLLQRWEDFQGTPAREGASTTEQDVYLARAV
ncbi:MAG TPA: class I SAM-dependent methyltransferase [Polyangia bacterium]|nr:class I SAM-dependent methyltransferase [Polyangia bacterium]